MRFWTLIAVFMMLPAVAFAQETGVLQVSSTIPGAKVLVDLEEFGVTPLAKEVPAGAHNVRITADGFDPWVMRVDVGADSKANVHAKLLKGGGTVEFLVEPVGAMVLMDGQPVGKTPIRLTGLAPGSHSWEVKAPLHEDLAGSFQFPAGGNQLVLGNLVSSRGLFSIRSAPLGATVILDGEEVGVTPLELEGITPGLHRLRFVMDRRPIVLREVDTSDGTKGEVSANLPRRSGRLTVNTGHPEGLVLLNEQEVGQGRFVFLKVARGQYELKVVTPDTKAASRKLRMPAKGAVALRASMVPSDAKASSKLENARAWNSPWVLYTAAGVGGAGVVSLGVVVAKNAGDDAEPTPQPDPGDVVIYLP